MHPTHSPSSSVGASASCLDLTAGHELKLRPCRASSGDLQSLMNGRPEEWDLTCKVKRAPANGGGGGSRLSPRALPALARSSWRRVLSTAVALALFLALFTQHRSLYRHGQNAFAGLYYGLDPSMLGRSDARFPSPRCCPDGGCAAAQGGGGAGSDSTRVAVVTYLRDDAYAPLLQQLECTLRRSNPGLELALMHVPGELGGPTLALAAALNITLLPVAPLDFPNTYEPRYSRNWLKVRALGLTQYSRVLLVDADVAVAGPLAPVLAMPADFAAVWDQSKWLNRFRTAVTRINGGVFLLRPCAAVEVHMEALLAAHPKLRFTHHTAEQDFFGWYYRYTGVTLPLQYNAQAEQSLLPNGLTVGGVAPTIVHFTRNKPFHGPRHGALGHQYLCSSEEVRRRAFLKQHGAAPGASAAAAGQPAGNLAEGQEQPVAGGRQQQRQQAVEVPAAGGEQEQQGSGATPETDALLQQGQKELP